MITILTRIAATVLMVVLTLGTSSGAEIEVTCAAGGSGDQDDMCIWLHPDDPAQSKIITSDKDKSTLFVYALDGQLLYAYALPMKPGNIDIVYNFPLGGELIDLVGFNERATSNERFVFYKMDKQTGELSSLGAPLTTESWSDELYGFCLYKSPNNDQYYAFGCDESSMIQQYRLFDDGAGNLVMEHKRTWQNGSGGPTEGMAADHEAGLLYAGNENQGIYVYHADEDQSTDHIRFLPVKNDTLAADVEGLAIYYAAGGQGYLIASSQGQDFYSVFERDGDNAFVRKFSLTGVGDSDGIDVLNVPLNGTFTSGIFACHNGRVAPCPVNLVKWEDIADDNSPDLMIDTSYWDPREAMLTRVGPIQYDPEIVFSIHPNPSQRQTIISLELPADATTRCVIYDVMGREVAVIFDGLLQAGKHEFLWNHAGSLQENKTGIYYCRVILKDKLFTKKLICR